MKVLFAGSFNPPTLGHTDIVKTAAGMFDEVIVCIMPNSEKKYGITAEDRLKLLVRCFEGIDNVKAVIGEGLTAEYARNCGCNALIRGIRNSSDLDYEMQIAEANRRIFGIETLFLPTNPEYGFISSTIVRDVASHGGDISKLVPVEIEKELIALFS